MKTKILGRTGLEVPIVGLGAAFIGIPTANQAAEEYPEDPNNLRGGRIPHQLHGGSTRCANHPCRH